MMNRLRSLADAVTTLVAPKAEAEASQLRLEICYCSGNRLYVRRGPGYPCYNYSSC